MERDRFKAICMEEGFSQLEAEWLATGSDDHDSGDPAFDEAAHRTACRILLHELISMRQLPDYESELRAHMAELMSNPLSAPKSDLVESILTALTGKDRPATIASASCVTCSGPAVEFNDSLSRKEYAISGMCQVCQDQVFSGEE